VSTGREVCMATDVDADKKKPPYKSDCINTICGPLGGFVLACMVAMCREEVAGVHVVSGKSWHGA
jgi:hypothetical protein